ncbi:MAG: hypothetical protein K6C35_07900 [Eubacterium sp.]|nr:hypothetical protein [Eubacterium sp.]
MKDRFSIFIILFLVVINWVIFIIFESIDEKNGNGTFTTVANVLLPSILAYVYVFLDNKNKSRRGTKRYRRTLGLILWSIVCLGTGFCISVFAGQNMWLVAQDKTENEYNGAEYLKFGLFATFIFIFMVLMIDLFAKLRDKYFAKRGLVVNSSLSTEEAGSADKEDSKSEDGHIRITLEDMERERVKKKSIAEICSINTSDADDENDDEED